MTENTQKLSRADIAERYFIEEGYNCAQAVLMAFAPELGLDKETAARLASSFGGGMGRLREVCGTVSAAFMAMGIAEGDYDPMDVGAKSEHYRKLQTFAYEFAEKHGSYICRRLLENVPHTDGPEAEPRSPEYYRRRHCASYVRSAAEMLDKHIGELAK